MGLPTVEAAPKKRKPRQAAPAEVSATGYISLSLDGRNKDRQIIHRSEGNLTVDFSRMTGEPEHRPLNPLQIKIKPPKPEDLIVTVTGTLKGKILIAQRMVLHLTPVQAANLEEVKAANDARLCRSHLNQLEAAKEQWALDENKPSDAEPAWADLLKNQLYLPRELKCPMGGNYRLGKVSEAPTCSIKGHLTSTQAAAEQP